MPRLASLEELNSTPENEFNEIIHLLFEPAPPLASKLYQKRPFESYHQLINIAEQVIGNLSPKEKIEVVNAHPRIGAPAKTLSAQSKQEQGAPVENLEQVLAKLKVLNEEYEAKFGFKFVVFVNGRSRTEIVRVLEERMKRTAQEELETGLRDMVLIARDRLSKLEKASAS